MSVLSRGTVLQGVSTQLPCHVGELLGAGGQGEVYASTLGGSPVALKWYFKRTATHEMERAITQLCKMGPPNTRFLWPQELVRGTATGFGYAMPLRPPRYAGIIDLMKGRVDPSFFALCTTGFQLADGFLQLHSRGLCYRDISFGNVFFDPKTGDVLICDNDNVGIDGKATADVLGTPRFMAPEIVTGAADPGSASDLWSLSVLLFYLLTVHHPLEGAREAAIKCLDLPAMTRLYGTHPLFIFHPKDTRNAPVPGLHDNALAYWPLYPEWLRALFTRAFVDGIADPQSGRVRESEWRGALLNLRDSIFNCSGCGSELFYDKGAPRCWSCGTNPRLPYRLRVDNSTMVMLNADTQLFPHHMGALYDLTAPTAEVARHPKDPSIWGLKNLSQGAWTATPRDAAATPVPPGRSVSLKQGTVIDFGTTTAEVRA